MKTLLLSMALLLVNLSIIAQKLPFQGYLEESGVPVNGTRTFIFELPDYGWTETIADVPIDNGLYNVVLGQINLLPDTIFSNTSETPLSITINSVNIGTVTLYKPLGGGVNEGLVTVKDPNGKVKGELNYFAQNNSGSVVLNGANDSTKVILGAANGGYGGFLGLYDSLRYSGLQLRVTNKGRGNLFTSNENHQNTGWFGGAGNDGFTQLISYDETETFSGALLLGSFADGKYPELYLEGSKQPNFGLGRFKVEALPNGEETAFLEINRSNGGGQARLSVVQDPGGADPTGAAGELTLNGNGKPNVTIGAKNWENHGRGFLNLLTDQPDGTGWWHSAVHLSADNNGTDAYGSVSLFKNGQGTMSLDGFAGAFRGRAISLDDPAGFPLIHMQTRGDGAASYLWTNQPDGQGWFFNGINAETFNNGTNAHGQLTVFNNNIPSIILNGEIGNIQATQLIATNNIEMEGGYLSVYKTNDTAGPDPTGTTGEIYVRGNGTPNVRIGGKSWENHGLGNITVFGSIDTGGGWAHEVANIGVSTDGTNEWGNIVLRNNATDMISLDANQGQITVGDPFGGSGVSIEALNGKVVVSNELKSMTANVGDYFVGTGIYLDGNTGGVSLTGVLNSSSAIQVGGDVFNAGTGVFIDAASGGIVASGELKSSTANVGNFFTGTGIWLDGNVGNISISGDISTIANIYATGTVAATTLQSSDGLVQTSDKRLKENILVLNNALSNTLKMRGVSYNWIDKNKSQKNQIGVIAQEVEEIYPEFVHTDDKGMKAVNYAQMTAVLIEAIKELNQKVVTLEAEVGDLEKENATLTSALNETKTLSEKINKLEKLLMEDRKVASN